MIHTDLEALKNIPDGFYWFKANERDKNPEIVEKSGDSISRFGIDYFYMLDNKDDLEELRGIYMRINPPDKFELNFSINI